MGNSLDKEWDKLRDKKLSLLLYDNGARISRTTLDDFVDVLDHQNILYELIQIRSIDELITGYIQEKIDKSDIICKIVYGEFNRIGIVQGILEGKRRLYTGNLLKTDIVSQDKLLVKAIMEKEHINTPKYIKLDKNNPGNALSVLNEKKRYIIKPNGTNTSLGIVLPASFDELKNAVNNLPFERYGNYFIEEYIQGRIISIGVMPLISEEYFITEPLEYLFDMELGFMDEKWKDNPQRAIAVDIPEKTLSEANATAVSLHKLIDAKGATRTDFIYSKDCELYTLEINSNIGFSRNHDFPTAARNLVGYDELVCMYLQTAYVKGE